MKQYDVFQPPTPGRVKPGRRIETMKATATHIESKQRKGDEAGPVNIDVVDVNGITLELVAHGYGGVIKQSCLPGIVYSRDDGKVYRGVYGDGWTLQEEVELPELPWHWYHEAAHMACVNDLRGKTVTVTTDRAESSYGQPVVLVDGEITDLHQYLRQPRS
jgi:hypothetical protein